MEEDLEKLDLFNKIYEELSKDAIEFADDAVNFAKDVAKNMKNFKYFSLTLVVYSIVFMALSFYFIRIPQNFMSALSLLTLCIINVFYAILLWKDYSRTVERYKALIDAEKELEEIKKMAEEASFGDRAKDCA